jgi:diguanylate cyclase (GGDEF)-like protein
VTRRPRPPGPRSGSPHGGLTDAVDQRDLAADERDRVADLRDEAGDVRDEAADARDVASNRRDAAAVGRDDAAERRDDAAASQEQGKGTPGSGPVTPAPPKVARRQAASDRRHSAEDRSAGAGSRAAAKGAREEANADRAESATERQRAAEHRENSALEREAASVDALTGAYVRGAGLGQLEQELVRAHRTNQPLTVAFLDVDHLKAVNDSDGHQAGDQLLARVVTTLRDRLRPYDLVVRYGGDEFVCVMSGLGRAEAEQRFALVNADLGQHGSVTVGVVTAEPEEGADALIARADAALYARRAALST